MRTFIAGLLGAIAMFIWATIAHVATPLATIGLSPIPDEPATMAALQTSLGNKAGLYFFPFMHGSPTDSKAMAAQAAKMKTQPYGLVAYQPPGAPDRELRQLGVEFGLELVESLLAAIVLAAVVTDFMRRLGISALIGLIAAMATNLSYWNWYGFSFDYTLANAFTELMKFVFAGAAIALTLGRRTARAR